MIRILYIDDEADIREIAQMSLELDSELEVRTCASGAEGIDQAVAWRPDLILLDVMMPGMDGPTVFMHLRGDNRQPPIFRWRSSPPALRRTK